LPARTGEAVRQRTTVPFAGVKFVDPKTGLRRRISGEIVIDTAIESAKKQQLEAEKQIAKLKREAVTSTRRMVKRTQASDQRRMADARRREAQQERDENWLIKDLARQRKDTENNRVRRGQEMSRMMMGGAGVLTAATMPISGFTPLTIGFASMSGIGFGVAAAAAVYVRALFDSAKALNKVQTSLLKLAESSEMVSERYERQRDTMKAIGAAQGFLVGEQTADRLKKWNVAIEENIGKMAVANEAWGRLRMEFSDFSRMLAVGALGGGELGNRASYRRLGAMVGAPGGALGRWLGRIIGGNLFQAGQENLASRIPALEEHLRNLEKGTFQAAFVGPEDLYNRIQKAAASVKPEEKEILELNKKQLEAQLRSAKAAEEAIKDDGLLRTIKDFLQTTTVLDPKGIFGF
jgi:hypothetical protein